MSDIHEEHRGYPADVIPLQYHAHMLLDEYRMGSFEQAIARAVTSGMHVLDLGTGTGVLSYFAARCGARVTAVEREPRVLAAARTALAAAAGDRVRLVHADAREYLPDEPVDVVICEMMHVGQLRERQIEVIDSFKTRYRRRFDLPLPRFLPEGCVQAVQPVVQDFEYSGYTVAAPLFQDPFTMQPRTAGLAAPVVFQQFFYADDLPTRCRAEVDVVAEHAGRLNAIRMITKNLLAVTYDPPGGVEWLMNYLVVPLRSAVSVRAGDAVQIRFDYRPGDEIGALADSLRVAVRAHTPAR